ncbi:MAG: cytochrome-c oxidase, cbb3-type subunit III [Devosia sp.]
MSDKQIDEPTGTETTGHEWDGIKELNTPLPRWWLWTFYACIVFAIGYTIVYPAWPMFSSATSGVLGYSSRAELAKELELAGAAKGGMLARLAETPVAEIVEDPDLVRFASAGGKSIFKLYCSQCHGTGAAGAVGYPNLNDDDWVWGGTVDQIYASIKHGARSEDPDTHFTLMPNFGTDEILSGEQIKTVAQQVAAMAGLDGGSTSDEGVQLYADNCAACHGDAGQGNIELGAAALNDKIWLYEGSIAAIETQISKPRHGVMPAWGSRLGDVAVKELAIYVHGLGGGQ